MPALLSMSEQEPPGHSAMRAYRDKARGLQAIVTWCVWIYGSALPPSVQSNDQGQSGLVTRRNVRLIRPPFLRSVDVPG